MSFQIKDFTSIVASMINLFRGNTTKITDFQPGSVARTLVEAPAMEIEEFYLKMFQGLEQGLPVSTFNSFDFAQLPASPATGVLTFYALGTNTADILIPQGTTARNPSTNQDYITTRDVTIELGDTEVSVSAVAINVGFVTNTSANAITVLVGNVAGVTGVSNLTAFTEGRDFESVNERKVRFREYIRSIQRGTLAAIRYGTTSSFVRDENNVIIERAALVSIDEPYKRDPIANAPGFVIVYAHNRVGGTSPTLIAEVKKRLEGYETEDGTEVPGFISAGVDLQVYAANEIALDVTGEIVLNPGFVAASVLAECTTAVREYLQSLNIGKQAIRKEIVEQIMRIDGVYDLTLSDPIANTPSDYTSKIIPGVVALTVAG